MSLDLPLVCGHVDATVALHESAAPITPVRVGETDIIPMDGAGFTLLDEVGASPSGAPVPWRLSGDEAVCAVEGRAISFIGVAQGYSVITIEVSRDEARGCWEHLRTTG